MKNKIKNLGLSFLLGIVLFYIFKALTNYLYMKNGEDVFTIFVAWVYCSRNLFGKGPFDIFLAGMLCIMVFLLIKLLISIKRIANLIRKYSMQLKYLFRPVISLICCVVAGKIFKIIIQAIFNSIEYSSNGKVQLFGVYTNQLMYQLNILNILTFIGIICLYLALNKGRIKRINNLFSNLQKMSDGNMDILINDKKHDDISYISNSVDNIVKKLKSTADNERKAQKTKSDLITNVSHDLRTPLTSIIGYLSLIDKDEYKDEVELRYYISIAYEKSKKLNVLINDLFELTKMQNYQIQLNKQKINLIELLGQLTAECEVLLKQNDIVSRIHFNENKLFINADPNKIVRVFENLISNSIKYAKEGHFIDIIARKEERYALVQVINYGEEILQSDLPYIFDRFYKIDKSRNSSIKGSGLGLSIAKNIVEMHNGIIIAKSSTAKTIFEVRLPLCDEFPISKDNVQ